MRFFALERMWEIASLQRLSQGKPKYPQISQKGQIHISSIDFPIFSHFVQFSSHAFPIISIQFLTIFFPILSHSFLMRFSSFRNF